MAQLAIINAYEEFMTTAQAYVDIETESAYQEALDTLEMILDSANDSLDEPLNPLINMLSNAIERYEMQDQELAAFVAESNSLPSDIALLKTIMKNHNLTGSDLPEIGDKTMVSKVLNEKRTLTRQAIERLASRFGIRPSMFFGEMV